MKMVKNLKIKTTNQIPKNEENNNIQVDRMIID
jgi:hypothetical protein